jgi:hypothetical protein
MAASVIGNLDDLDQKSVRSIQRSEVRATPRPDSFLWSNENLKLSLSALCQGNFKNFKICNGFHPTILLLNRHKGDS